MFGPFGDIDMSPTKWHLMNHSEEEGVKRAYELSCGKRPEEELYVNADDPWQINNVADDPKYAVVKAELRASLDEWMLDTEDPRALNDDDRFDKYDYYGRGKKKK